MDSGYLIDYLTFTTKKYTVDDVKVLLGLDEVPWEESKGKWFYQYGEYFMSIKILSDPKNEQDEGNVTVEMTGKGCRAFESFGHGDFDFLFNLAKDKEINVTRLDIAFDERENKINIYELGRLTMESDEVDKPLHFVSEFHDHSFIQPRRKLSKGATIYWGSKRSEVFYRIYDKAKERGDLESHWIRYECQMRKDIAQLFIETAYSEKYNGDWKTLYLEFLRKKMRFVERPPDWKDHKTSRYPTAEFWEEFLHHADKAQPFDRPGMEYNYDNLHDYVVKQAGQAIQVLSQLDNAEKMFHDIREHRKGKKLAPKYQEIIRQRLLWNQLRGVDAEPAYRKDGDFDKFE